MEEWMFCVSVKYPDNTKEKINVIVEENNSEDARRSIIHKIFSKGMSVLKIEEPVDVSQEIHRI